MTQHVDDEGPLQIGAVFVDKYRVTALLGRGGQASVYRAQHLVMGREVAIKIVYSVHGVRPEMVDRGKAEAEMLGKLDHPNVTRMYDAGFGENGLFYMVMELLEGRNLRATLADYGPLRVEEVLRLGIKIAHAMQTAHDQNIIHRDLKPDNLFIGRNSEPKVLDFGIARMMDRIGITRRKLGVLGTLVYMSPEQAKGQPNLTPQTDVCSLGIVLFELLIGKTPTVLLFEHDLASRGEARRSGSLRELAPLQVAGLPPLLSQLDARIPIYLAQVIQRAIAKSTEQRFQSMSELAAALQFCLDTWQVDAPPSSAVLNVRGRQITRDLSLPAPESERAPRVQQLEPAISRRETLNAAALGQQVTKDLKSFTGSNASQGSPSPPPLSSPSVAPGAPTAPLGSHLSALEAEPDAGGTQMSMLVPRNAQPAQRKSERELAELWADSGTPPPGTLAPRPATLTSRPPAVAARAAAGARRRTQIALARGALIVAGLVFGGTVGTIALGALYRDARPRHVVSAVASPAPIREPFVPTNPAPERAAEPEAQVPLPPAEPLAAPTPPTPSAIPAVRVPSPSPAPSGKIGSVKIATRVQTQPQTPQPTGVAPRATGPTPDKAHKTIY